METPKNIDTRVSEECVAKIHELLGDQFGILYASNIKNISDGKRIIDGGYDDYIVKDGQVYGVFEGKGELVINAAGEVVNDAGGYLAKMHKNLPEATPESIAKQREEVQGFIAIMERDIKVLKEKEELSEMEAEYLESMQEDLEEAQAHLASLITSLSDLIDS